MLFRNILQLKYKLTSSTNPHPHTHTCTINHRYDKTVEEMDTSSLQDCPVAIDKTTGEITRAAAKMKENFFVRQQKEHIR